MDSEDQVISAEYIHHLFRRPKKQKKLKVKKRELEIKEKIINERNKEEELKTLRIPVVQMGGKKANKSQGNAKNILLSPPIRKGP